MQIYLPAGAVNPCRAQLLVPNVYVIKGPRALEKQLIQGLGQKTHKMSLDYLAAPERKHVHTTRKHPTLPELDTAPTEIFQ